MTTLEKDIAFGHTLFWCMLLGIALGTVFIGLEILG